MRRVSGSLSVLILSLAGLAVFGHVSLTRVTQGWFDADLAARSRLALESARQGLIANWQSVDRLGSRLHDITRDERIMGAAACNPDGAVRASTGNVSSIISCDDVWQALGAQGSVPRTWTSPRALASGRVHVFAASVESSQETLGAIVLVHDLSYLDRREATTRNLLVAAFFVVTLAASAITVASLHVTRRGWMRELRRALSGDATQEFHPLVRDLRSQIERLVSERDREARGGSWGAERLRQALRQHLQGERIVILANREPYIHEQHADGGTHVVHPASGLVTALEPVMRACSGVWVAHGSGSADRATVDARDHVLVPPGEGAYVLRRVWMNEAEENGYYYGFANEGLWPLCHLAHERPLFRAEDHEHYVRINQRFADAVCEEVDSPEPIILVQDYHFALAPRMIRKRLPRATIITFWHIPWPNAERIGICPWRDELISGLLGSSIIGFHTQQHCNHFIDAVDAYMESRIDRESSAVFQGKRKTLVRSYPISIDWPVERLRDVPEVKDARAAVRGELGLPADTLLGVGVDRLDYTKGIEERLAAVDALLARHPEFRGRFTFIQLAAPSRTKLSRYRELNDRVEALAESINARWSSGSYRPVMLLRAHHEPASVFRFYRAADLCYVSSLHDGMNLVAKEFVAARNDERGVLVLSQFTGAARDLTEALIVNPYDLEQAADAMAAGLCMSEEEQRERMRSMRQMVAEFNVYRWAGRMLVDAAELRRKDRIADGWSPWRLAATEGEA